MRKIIAWSMAAGGLAAVSSIGMTADRSAPPAPIAALVACRGITDPAARLACFDETVARLAAATAKQEVVVVDRREVQEARRSLFGFNMPKLSLFTHGKDEPDLAEINTVARHAMLDRDGRWIVTMENGAVWRQTDDNVIASRPHEGSKVVLRRATLGSYFMRIDNQPGVKAHRES